MRKQKDRPPSQYSIGEWTMPSEEIIDKNLSIWNEQEQMSPLEQQIKSYGIKDSDSKSPDQYNRKKTTSLKKEQLTKKLQKLAGNVNFMPQLDLSERRNKKPETQNDFYNFEEGSKSTKQQFILDNSNNLDTKQGFSNKLIKVKQSSEEFKTATGYHSVVFSNSNQKRLYKSGDKIPPYSQIQTSRIKQDKISTFLESRNSQDRINILQLQPNDRSFQFYNNQAPRLSHSESPKKQFKILHKFGNEQYFKEICERINQTGNQTDRQESSRPDFRLFQQPIYPQEKIKKSNEKGFSKLQKISYPFIRVEPQQFAPLDLRSSNQDIIEQLRDERILHSSLQSNLMKVFSDMKKQKQQDKLIVPPRLEQQAIAYPKRKKFTLKDLSYQRTGQVLRNMIQKHKKVTQK